MADISFPWERSAFTGAPMPDNLPFADMCAYQALANLSARFQAGAVQKEDATKEKRLIKMNWQKQREQEDYYKKCSGHLADLFRDTELARSAYRKARSPEQLIAAADKFMETLDGSPIRHGDMEIK